MIDDVQRADRAGSGAEPEAPPDGEPEAPPAGELTETQLEALLFVAEKPLSRREISTLAGVDRATVDERLGDLEVSLASRGLRLILAGDQVELTTAPEAGALIARYVGVDAVRLSPAALETLAIVAYRQPCTRAVIERIRGVDSDYTVRTLLHRRLIVELGRSDTPGRPFLYGTGFEFLERFGLTSLEELPPLDVDVAERLLDEETPSGTGDTPGQASDAPLEGADVAGNLAEAAGNLTALAGSPADTPQASGEPTPGAHSTGPGPR
jgi:segregation and condensation protein B